MFAQVTITGLDEAEETAREILKHVEAVRELQRSSTWGALTVKVELSKEKAASGN